MQELPAGVNRQQVLIKPRLDGEAGVCYADGQREQDIDACQEKDAEVTCACDSGPVAAKEAVDVFALTIEDQSYSC